LRKNRGKNQDQSRERFEFETDQDSHSEDDIAGFGHHLGQKAKKVGVLATASGGRKREARVRDIGAVSRL
jgi:hypothetical protein